jgi:hypothetical protein
MLALRYEKISALGNWVTFVTHVDSGARAGAFSGSLPRFNFTVRPRAGNTRSRMAFAAHPSPSSAIASTRSRTTVHELVRGQRSARRQLADSQATLWTHLSLLDECRGCAEQALAALAAGAGRDVHREMQLHAALRASMMYTGGAVSEIEGAGTKALRQSPPPRALPAEPRQEKIPPCRAEPRLCARRGRHPGRARHRGVRRQAPFRATGARGPRRYCHPPPLPQ